MKHLAHQMMAISLLLGMMLQATAQKPNIILILSDDLGYGDVSSLNAQSKIHTPNMDAIAQKGMAFTDAHSNSSVCSPTRYGILTGRYAWRTRLQSGVLWSYDKPLIDSGRLTIASLLKENGYQTACMGKWHLGLDWQMDNNGKVDLTKPVLGGPRAVGFDYFFGITASLDIPPYVYIENERVTASSFDTVKASGGKAFWREGIIGNDFKHDEVLPNVTAKTVEYIRGQAKRKQPFFLYLALPSPHTPILPTAAYKGKSGTNDYGDFVLMTDDMVGQVLNAIREAGIEKNTLVIFTSDNGCSPSADFKELAAAGHYPSYHFRGAKADIFEGGHRIPFMVSWPDKIKPATSCAQTICLTDLMATIAEITGMTLPENAGEDSYSLLPLFTQKNDYLRNATIHHSIDGFFSIRQQNWKLEMCAGSGGWSSPTEKQAGEMHLPPMQLYNLATDESEKTNVANQYPEVVKMLTAQMQAIIEDGRSTKGPKQKNDVPVYYGKNGAVINKK